ncbi:glutamine-hydrolyzing GMP synthase [Candidatus Fermentibacteria bacterium]|nr:glutamine-hydrolyzing GMP synthase [Candidatus Fermentibacteria bacterium]
MIRGGVAVLDFGSQYSQLIARRVREIGVYCELVAGNAPYEEVEKLDPRALILSGGPRSVYEEEAPRPDPRVLQADVPLLGICYGMHLLALGYGGEVQGSDSREYGPARVRTETDSLLFDGVSDGARAWMSHGDRVTRLPEGFVRTAGTESLPIAAMEDRSGLRFGVQFHPEVRHTEFGDLLLRNFLLEVSSIQPDWNMSRFRSAAIAGIRERMSGGAKVVLGLSGGVDSSVVAALLHEAVPGRFTPIFVDTGLLRRGERESVETTFRDHFGMDLLTMDAGAEFVDALRGVADPESKRKIIGRKFVEVFERAAESIEGITHLAQGTLYPDVIESTPFRGPSATIKSHHNVGGLPERMDLQLLEPLRELFKDEVRSLGRELGLPEEMVSRHPFPGPGLAVRIIGEVSAENLELLRSADGIFLDFLKRKGIYDEIWQAFAVLLPIHTVGVMGDRRTYDRVVALRAVTSVDGMTADWYRMDPSHLAEVSAEIVNRVEGISRVVYDVSSKPPGTIEWE